MHGDSYGTKAKGWYWYDGDGSAVPPLSNRTVAVNMRHGGRGVAGQDEMDKRLFIMVAFVCDGDFCKCYEEDTKRENDLNWSCKFLNWPLSQPSSLFQT